MRNRITVIGSINVDITAFVDQYPEKGDTVFGGKMEISSGGKGANQAVACKKLGADVSLIGCIGDDAYGDFAVKELNRVGIQVDQITVIPEENTGMALITIDESAENSIIVVKGANEYVGQEKVINNLELIKSSRVLLVQAEIPDGTVLQAMKLASEQGVYVIYDPAPVQGVNPKLLAWADVITPNVQETKYLTGINAHDEESAHRAAQQFEFLGVKNCIIKLGAKGAYVYMKGEGKLIEGISVDAIDSVGAGDCFAGALAVKLSQGNSLMESAVYANFASALKVTKYGAQSGIPTNEELECFIRDHSRK